MVGKERREGGCPAGMVELGGFGDKRRNLEGRSLTWDAHFPNICDGAFVKMGIIHLNIPKCICVPSDPAEGSRCDRAEGVAQGPIPRRFASRPTWKKAEWQLLDSGVHR